MQVRDQVVRPVDLEKMKGDWDSLREIEGWRGQLQTRILGEVKRRRRKDALRVDEGEFEDSRKAVR
jgi:hypothetical protein